MKAFQSPPGVRLPPPAAGPPEPGEGHKRHDVRAVSVYDSRRIAREQSLRYPPDYTLEFLDACYERLYRVLDERPEEDWNLQQLAALSVARFLKRRALQTACELQAARTPACASHFAQALSQAQRPAAAVATLPWEAQTYVQWTPCISQSQRLEGSPSLLKM